MHTSCLNSANHFCQNAEAYEKSDSNNSLNLNSAVNSNQNISQKTSIENLDYWRYLSSNESNEALSTHNLTDNLVYDELPVFSSVPKSADYQVAKSSNQKFRQQRNSFDCTSSSTKFSFNFVNETKSTPTTPFKIRHDKNNNIPALTEEMSSFSIKCNQIKSNLVGNSKLTSCIKNWWYTKTGRRSSKESLTKANLADKPVRSKYSLTIDDKITKKQLENLIKKNKKANKVRFNVSEQQQQSNNQFKPIPQHKPLTPRSCNVEQFLFEQQRLIDSQRKFSNLPPNPNASTLAYVQTHIVSSSLSPVHQQQFTFKSHYDQKPLTKLEKKLMEVKKELLENKPLNKKNQSLAQKDSLGVVHVYCPSKIGYQKRHIPKLFRNSQNVQFPDDSKLGDELLKAEKQLLTKARTLSMEAKTDICHSFFATWPTSSMIVGKVEDLTATEEEINRSLM